MNTNIHPLILIAGAIVSYLIGNINPAILLGHIYGVDVRQEGSGNAGTTNVMRTIGKKAGVITFLVDMLKGFLVAFVALRLVGLVYAMICAVAVVAGHMWPAVFKFRGGKGVATTFGVLLAVNPYMALILIALWIAIVLISRRVSVAVIVAIVVAIPLGLWYHPIYSVWIACIAVLVLIKHSRNIKRILRHEEPKMSFGNKDKRE
jgi:glycerol-3-phosphate acyltransferase PlsY